MIEAEYPESSGSLGFNEIKELVAEDLVEIKINGVVIESYLVPTGKTAVVNITLTGTEQ
jgi:hypothetical protein